MCCFMAYKKHHCERRQYFAETAQTVNKRALAALNAGLKVIILSLLHI